jgi:hypothetical protein
MAEEIVALMSVVGYLAKTEDDEGEEQRVLLLKNYLGFRTKTRTPWDMSIAGSAPDEIENPTISDLLDTLQITTNGTAPKRRRRKTTKED